MGSTDYVLGAGADSRIFVATLFEVILVLAIVGTAATLYPVIRKTAKASPLRDSGVPREPFARPAFGPYLRDRNRDALQERDRIWLLGGLVMSSSDAPGVATGS